MVYTIVVHLYANDDPSHISKLKDKLMEASLVYSKDKETLSWFVMQDVNDPRKFTIVERYLRESVRVNCFLEKKICSKADETCAEPTISSRESLLEDVRSICESVAR
jgi:hypothetical protein